MDPAVNQRLKNLRKALGMNQSKFSKALGISQTAYSKVEKEINGISLEVFRTAILKFSLDPGWLLTGNGEIPKLLLENVGVNVGNHVGVNAQSRKEEKETNNKKSENSDNPGDEESVKGDIDLSNMKAEDINRLIRVEESLRERLKIMHDLVNSLQKENEELRQLVEFQQTEDDTGEIRQFGKTA